MTLKPIHTTVTDLIHNFHNSLFNLANSLLEVGIQIDENFSGDAWDEVTEAVYRHLVNMPIKHALYGEKEILFSFPKYEFSYEDFSELNFIQVIPKTDNNDNVRYFFSGFIRRTDDGFLNVNCIEISNTDKALNNHVLPYKDVTFKLSFLENGTRKVIENLVIPWD